MAVGDLAFYYTLYLWANLTNTGHIYILYDCMLININNVRDTRIQIPLQLLYYTVAPFKLDSYLNTKRFSSLSRMRISVFEVMSVYLIDQYQMLSQKRWHFMSWKKFNFKSLSCSWHRFLLGDWKHSTWVFYRRVVAWSLNGVCSWKID